MNWIRLAQMAIVTASIAATPAVAADTLASTSDPAILREALARVAIDMYSPQAKIYIGALPDHLPGVPLPEGVTVLASIDRGSFDMADKRLLFESANPQATMDAYVAHLKAAGWVEEAPAQLGFVRADTPESHRFCGNDPAASIVVTRPASPSAHALDVIVQPYPANTRDACSGRSRLISIPGAGTMPRFIAPSGATITPSTQPFVDQFSRVSATIVSHQAIGALLASLSSQMIEAHWRHVDAAVGRTTASATFAITDERGRSLEALITLYAVPGRVDTYLGSTSVTDLKTVAQ